MSQTNTPSKTRRTLAAAAVVVGLVAPITPAHAGPLSDLVAGLKASSANDDSSLLGGFFETLRITWGDSSHIADPDG